MIGMKDIQIQGDCIGARSMAKKKFLFIMCVLSMIAIGGQI